MISPVYINYLVIFINTEFMLKKSNSPNVTVGEDPINVLADSLLMNVCTL